MPNALKSNERRRIWVIKTFKIEIKKGGGSSNSAVLQDWLTPSN